MATKRRSFTAIILSVLLFISSFALIFGNLQTKKAKANSNLDAEDCVYYFTDTTSPVVPAASIDLFFPNYMIRTYGASGVNSLEQAIIQLAQTASIVEFFATPTENSGITQITSGTLPQVDGETMSNVAIVFEITHRIPPEMQLATVCELLRDSGFKIMIIGAFEPEDFNNWVNISTHIDTFHRFYVEQFFMDTVINEIVTNHQGLNGATYIFDSRLVTINVNASFDEVYRSNSWIRYLFSEYREAFNLTGDEGTAESIIESGLIQIVAHNQGTNIFTKLSILEPEELMPTLQYGSDNFFEIVASPRYLIGFCHPESALHNVVGDIKQAKYLQLGVFILKICDLCQETTNLVDLFYDKGSSDFNHITKTVDKVDQLILEIEALFATE